MSRSFLVAARALAPSLALLAACGGSEQHDEWPTEPAAAAALEPSSQLAPSSSGVTPSSSAPTTPSSQEHALPPGLVSKHFEPQPGWSKLRIEDASPLCVFSSDEARVAALFPDQAERQTLHAGSPVVFGAFAPGCIHESCDQVPSLQCTLERKGSVITVKSAFWGYHKDGTYCTEGCRPITASCKTPPLEAGRYTVRHGETTFELKVPSTLREPCFGVDAAADRMPPRRVE